MLEKKSEGVPGRSACPNETKNTFKTTMCVWRICCRAPPLTLSNLDTINATIRALSKTIQVRTRDAAACKRTMFMTSTFLCVIVLATLLLLPTQFTAVGSTAKWIVSVGLPLCCYVCFRVVDWLLARRLKVRAITACTDHRFFDGTWLRCSAL